jgi:diaminohydroxyphosphoribosylaminopyrimidine deaminase/5-amino-6-(5-phosphoribosylamino)uracil reductase
VLKTLFESDRQHVFLEGGPTLAAAFLTAGLVDEIVTYVAPLLLGAGQPAVADLGITTIADALRPVVTDVTVLEGLDGEQPDLRLTMQPGLGSSLSRPPARRAGS